MQDFYFCRMPEHDAAIEPNSAGTQRTRIQWNLSVRVNCAVSRPFIIIIIFFLHIYINAPPQKDIALVLQIINTKLLKRNRKILQVQKSTCVGCLNTFDVLGNADAKKTT